MAASWGFRRQLAQDLSNAERDLRQTETRVANQLESPSRLRQQCLHRNEAEATLSHHDFHKRMALHHAH
ncbi:hypothetical protein NDU88_002291 [Pleurodeles waltl]|uniref:Uncharacterized protein n=1 Tax=Pleurodeles waltl TaxID=8319 RepID=A0AAV7LF98_PLEWA|nr:hypothetical protein NDU88_002291 [Pleurodeles waltl]